jgi:hypothetical protein
VSLRPPPPPRMPRISIPREERNGDTATPRPPRLDDLPTHELVADTADQIGILGARVDALITDQRELRADQREIKAICLENQREIMKTQQGVFECLSLLRPVEAKATEAKIQVMGLVKRMPEVERKADHAIREAKAARDASERTSKTEEQLAAVTIDFARRGAELVTKGQDDAIEARAARREAIAARRKAALRVAVPVAKSLAMGVGALLIAWIAMRLGVRP